MSIDSIIYNRRRFLRDLGVSAAAIPFLGGLGSLYAQDGPILPKQRLVIVFSPNGTIVDNFWPETMGEAFELKSILAPLEPFRDRTLVMRGVKNMVRGDGDNHMRGMSCLLTAKELSPGNIQGGSDSPAGWASGISIDQELRNFFQNREETRTRFGSLEFGVAVPDRADPWTRMCYAGGDRPVAPIDDPNRMLSRLYGKMKDKDMLVSVLDGVQGELKKLSGKLSPEDRQLAEQHLALIREMNGELSSQESQADIGHAVPEVDPEIELVNDNTPAISRIQIELLVNSLATDMARVATLQYMRSVGQARMNWLGIEEGHHGLSHEPDNNKDAQEKLEKINHWFCGEVAFLAKRLSETPEPSHPQQSMLDNTLIVWTNELGKGNSHTLDDIPMVMIGGGLGFKMGRAMNMGGVAHNRLWISLAKAMGHNIKTFGTESLCEGGALELG